MIHHLIFSGLAVFAGSLVLSVALVPLVHRCLVGDC